MPDDHDYDKPIADAAREYVAARRAADLMRDEASRERLSRASEKLSWLTEAERYGWNPGDFVSERDHA